VTWDHALGCLCMVEEINSNGIVIKNNIFQIGSKKLFINSGEIHYFRISPDQWEDRLIKAKSLGLNTVSTFICWSFHEEKFGEFDIRSIGKDLDHFLHLCENKGFYIIIRPGPWIGADLKNGGIPNWILEEHPKIMSLNDIGEVPKWSSKEIPPISCLSPTYLRLVENYFDNICEILRRHMYPHGGIIMLQLVNAMSITSSSHIFDSDYNPVALEFYKRYLKGKYKDIEIINALYNQSFLNIEHITPPSTKTQEDAAHSDNEFRNIGEFIRNMDWMEFKEHILEEYIATISYFLRKKEIYIPYFVDIPYIGSPINVQGILNAYKTKILVGFTINEEFLLDVNNVEELLETGLEILKTQMPLFNFIPELTIGSPNKIVPPNRIHLLVRLLLGHGIKGMNYYMGVGGRNPQLSANEKPSNAYASTVGFDGKSLIIDETGNSYDFGAPIGIKGQKNPSFEVIELTSQYIQSNFEQLLSAKKVYDDEIGCLFYHPYSRLRFDTTKFGFAVNYHQIIRDNPHPEYTIINKLGYHPKWIDLQNTSIEELRQYKILVILFSVFLHKDCMNLLKLYMEEGGTLLSFYDIPIRNEKLQPDDTLSSLYLAVLHKKESIKKIIFNKDSFSSYGSIYSYILKEDKANNSKFSLDEIIASDSFPNPNNIYAFHRKVKKGDIYHFGFVPTSDLEAIAHWRKMFNVMNVPQKKIHHPEGLTVLRLQCDTKEELITVANLSQNKLEKFDIVLHDLPQLDGATTLQLNDIVIPKKSSVIWSVNKTISENVNIKVCTSEINDIRKVAKSEKVEYIISGFHFQGSKNTLEIFLRNKPIKVLSGKKDITKRLFKADKKSRIQFYEISQIKPPLYLLNAKYSDDFELCLHFEGAEITEIVDFNMKKKNIFLD